MKHESDGTTYARPEIYMCKNCKRRLTSEEYHNGVCSGKEE